MNLKNHLHKCRHEKYVELPLQSLIHLHSMEKNAHIILHIVNCSFLLQFPSHMSFNSVNLPNGDPFYVFLQPTLSLSFILFTYWN